MSRPSPRPTFYEYLVQVVCLYPPNQRVGQWYFNALAGVRSDLAERVRDTDLDPFHRNDRLPAFLAWTHEHWDAP